MEEDAVDVEIMMDAEVEQMPAKEEGQGVRRPMLWRLNPQLLQTVRQNQHQSLS